MCAVHIDLYLDAGKLDAVVQITAAMVYMSTVEPRRQGKTCFLRGTSSCNGDIITFLESAGIYSYEFYIKAVWPRVSSHPPSTQSDNGWIKAISRLCMQSLH